ncbi:MAG: geranylgeranyl reductase family protein [Proteobacteria bacterium]|nr:geranylgeranyl reductase family protein [Pseudomonadota bacterium]
MMHDVVVVGGGPVGSYTASILAERGFDVLVLEGSPSPGDRAICTGLIGVEAFERFHLSTGSVVNTIENVTFVSPSGFSFSYRPGSPRALLVDRCRFDRDMADMALGQGAELKFNSLVRDVKIREHDVIVEVESPGRRLDLRAKLAVVACGFNPELTEKLGLGSPTEFLQGGQVEVDCEGVKETEVYVGRLVAPDSFAWVVPIGPEKARIGVITRENADVYLRSFLKSPMIGSRIKGEKPEISVGAIPIRPIPKSSRERVLVVGEAAGLVKPTTCGGIYYGLISAEFAAQTIEEAFSRGRFTNEFLKKYEQKWRHELASELEIGYRFRQIFSTIGDEKIDRLFEILNSDGISPLIHRMAQFDWHKDLILTLSKQGIFRKYLEPLSVFAERFRA